MIKHILKRQPERAALATSTGKILWVNSGDKTSVQNAPFEIIQRLKPTVFYHNHPYGIGAFVSVDDERVYTGLRLALDYSFYALVTDFVEVKLWYVWMGSKTVNISEVKHSPYRRYSALGGLWFNLEKFMRERHGR